MDLPIFHHTAVGGLADKSHLKGLSVGTDYVILLAARPYRHGCVILPDFIFDACLSIAHQDEVARPVEEVGRGLPFALRRLPRPFRGAVAVRARLQRSGLEIERRSPPLRLQPWARSPDPGSERVSYAILLTYTPADFKA